MFKKSKNCHFSKGVNPWFWSKNGHFLNFFFLGKIGQENVFYDILERKNAFLGYKNKRFEKSKNCIILKRLIHGFWTKMSFLELLFFTVKQARKMSLTIFQHEKTPFQPLKSRRIKSRKIHSFLKGLTQGFGLKMEYFLTSVFQVIYARNMCFTIFQNKKTPFQAIKTRSSKSRKIDIFPKGLTHGFGPKMAIFQPFFFRQYRPAKCLL